MGRSLFQCGLNQAGEWFRLSVGTGEKGMVTVCTQRTEMKIRQRWRRSRRNYDVRCRGNYTTAQAWCRAALAVDCEAWARWAVNMKTPLTIRVKLLRVDVVKLSATMVLSPLFVCWCWQGNKLEKTKQQRKEVLMAANRASQWFYHRCYRCCWWWCSCSLAVLFKSALRNSIAIPMWAIKRRTANAR